MESYVSKSPIKRNTMKTKGAGVSENFLTKPHYSRICYVITTKGFQLIAKYSNSESLFLQKGKKFPQHIRTITYLKIKYFLENI